MDFKDGPGEHSLSISLDPNHAPDDPAAGGVRRTFEKRRRDRHGRGLRGSLLPTGLPGARTRGEKFEDLVVDSAERLRELWPAALASVAYLVEEIPQDLEGLLVSGNPAPLGKHTHGTPALFGDGLHDLGIHHTA